MRRLVAVQRELHGGDTSQSDWSEEDEEAEPETDDPDAGLDHLSMAANGGLTDAEGAMSGEERGHLDSGELIIPSPDVNSMYDCGDIGDGPEMDDTSLSSRASSRIFDSDQIYSAESMHGGM